MDPLALSSAFATIVGLLVNFKAERSEATLSEFMSWLREQHQDQVALSIAQSEALSREITSLLAVNHGDLVTRLEGLNKQISKVAHKIDSISVPAPASSHTAAISQQAKSVLRQIVSTGTNVVIEAEDNAGNFTYLCGGGSIDQIQFAEPRFIKEDFDHLVKRGFLKIERQVNSARFFVPTRSGVNFAEGLADA